MKNPFNFLLKKIKNVMSEHNSNTDICYRFFFQLEFWTDIAPFHDSLPMKQIVEEMMITRMGELMRLTTALLTDNKVWTNRKDHSFNRLPVVNYCRSQESFHHLWADHSRRYIFENIDFKKDGEALVQALTKVADLGWKICSDANKNPRYNEILKGYGSVKDWRFGIEYRTKKPHDKSMWENETHKILLYPQFA